MRNSIKYSDNFIRFICSRAIEFHNLTEDGQNELIGIIEKLLPNLTPPDDATPELEKLYQSTHKKLKYILNANAEKQNPTTVRIEAPIHRNSTEDRITLGEYAKRYATIAFEYELLFQCHLLIKSHIDDRRSFDKTMMAIKKALYKISSSERLEQEAAGQLRLLEDSIMQNIDVSQLKESASGVFRNIITHLSTVKHNQNLTDERRAEVVRLNKLDENNFLTYTLPNESLQKLTGGAPKEGELETVTDSPDCNAQPVTSQSKQIVFQRQSLPSSQKPSPRPQPNMHLDHLELPTSLTVNMLLETLTSHDKNYFKTEAWAFFSDKLNILFKDSTKEFRQNFNSIYLLRLTNSYDVFDAEFTEETLPQIFYAFLANNDPLPIVSSLLLEMNDMFKRLKEEATVSTIMGAT